MVAYLGDVLRQRPDGGLDVLRDVDPEVGPRMAHNPYLGHFVGLQTILQKDCVPLVYGDVCLDEKRGWTIISTEQILAYLTPLLKPRRILLAGEVSGVYSGDPTTDSNALPIPVISPANLKAVRAGLTGADGYDVTGGMLTKVESMVELVEAHPGLEVGVISGLELDQVYAALIGQPLTGGTVIRAE